MSRFTLRPIRLALVGVGKIARDRHLPAIARDPRFELVAAASREGRVEDLPSYDSIEGLLAGGHELDAVSICTPPEGRAVIAAAAMDAGLDVMIEKPPATTPDEAAVLEARAEAAAVVLFAAWHSREAAGVAAARDWLAGRQVRLVEIIWREDIRRWHPGQDWILAPDGFGVFDPGINALSIATEILLQPITVESADFAIPCNRQMPIVAHLQMRSGLAEITAHFDFLHAGRPQWDIIVVTDRGRLTLSEGGRVLVIDGAVTEGPDEEYSRLYARFAKLIESRKSHVDVAPLQLVADAFQIATRRTSPEFHW
jgi:predicted dehydrogenase